MNLSLGDGLTIMSIFSFIIAIVYRVVPSRKTNCNTVLGQCADHLQIATEQATIKATLKNVEYGVEELREGQASIREQLTNFINRFIQV